MADLEEEERSNADENEKEMNNEFKIVAWNKKIMYERNSIKK